jgi:hypothetical protein
MNSSLPAQSAIDTGRTATYDIVSLSPSLHSGNHQVWPQSGGGTMSHRTNIIALVAACALARGSFAQVPAAPSNPVGVWRGTSLCRVRPSPCNDEIVVYRITRVNASDSVSLDARKIVNGQEEEMGVLGCRSTASGAELTCTLPKGVWHFTIRGDSLVGELRLPDNRKYRDVSTARSR